METASTISHFLKVNSRWFKFKKGTHNLKIMILLSVLNETNCVNHIIFSEGR